MIITHLNLRRVCGCAGGMEINMEVITKAGSISQSGCLLLLFDHDVNPYSGAKLGACGIFHLPGPCIMAGAVRRYKINGKSMAFSWDCEIYSPADRYILAAHSTATYKSKGIAVNPDAGSRILKRPAFGKVVPNSKHCSTGGFCF